MTRKVTRFPDDKSWFAYVGDPQGAVITVHRDELTSTLSFVIDGALVGRVSDSQQLFFIPYGSPMVVFDFDEWRATQLSRETT